MSLRGEKSARRQHVAGGPALSSKQATVTGKALEEGWGGSPREVRPGGESVRAGCLRPVCRSRVWENPKRGNRSKLDVRPAPRQEEKA